MYSGVFRDVYREFMIQVNEEYLGCRGENTCTFVHACTCSQARCRVEPLAQSAGCKNETPARGTEKKKNRFHYSLYCLVGFVLVAVKDVMKLLEDNQQDTDSLPQLWRPELFSAL